MSEEKKKKRIIGRRIQIEAKKKELAMARKLYQEYKKRAANIIKSEFKTKNKIKTETKEIKEKIEKEIKERTKSYKHFKENLLTTRKKGESKRDFVSRYTATSFNRLTKREAINLKKEFMQLAEENKDNETLETVSEWTIKDLISDPSKQHELYDYLKNNGKSTEETKEWWKEHIVGSD